MNTHELDECPLSPNCVSTLTQQKSKLMAPLLVPPSITTSACIEKIKQVVQQVPRTQLLKERENYLHFTFKSLIFRFVDDVEFLLDTNTRELHFRSASRVGHSDLGANKKRMQRLLEDLATSFLGQD